MHINFQNFKRFRHNYYSNLCFLFQFLYWIIIHFQIENEYIKIATELNNNVPSGPVIGSKIY